MNGAEAIAEILRTVKRIEAHIGASPKSAASSAAAGSAIAPASDYEMNGEYGDPEVRKDPKRWQGQSYVGRHYSQTEPDYLDVMAGFLAWKAGKDDEDAAKAPDAETAEKKRKYAGYARKDASLALGWRDRLRAHPRTVRKTDPEDPFASNAYDDTGTDFP